MMVRALTLAELSAYVAWLDDEIARYESRRLELRADQRFEQAAQQECYRTALQEARSRLLSMTSPSCDGESR